MERISEEHLQHWQEHGYAIVNDFLTAEELAAAQAEIYRTFPSLEEYRYAPSLYRNDFRGGHMKTLPFLGDILNFVAVLPDIVSFVERALGTKRIALAQSLVWARYPEPSESNFPLHVDYMISSILYPNPQAPLDVSFILYYVDVDEELGPTRVVSRQHFKDRLLVPDTLDKNEHPELYQNERPINVPAGSMLIYDMGTLHRPTNLISHDRTRYSHHFMYRSEEAPWIGSNAWTTYGFSPELQRFMEQASPRQRELFGFPSPGHAYWNEETLAGVAARYPAMDMMPYLEAADLPTEQMDRLREELRYPRLDKTGLSMPDPWQ
jgi:hypothetical protein